MFFELFADRQIVGELAPEDTADNQLTAAIFIGRCPMLLSNALIGLSKPCKGESV